MIDIPCVIFAGGKSSRMGEDKALLPFGAEHTLTQYQLSRLQKIFTAVYISCKNSDKFDFEANFIEDDDTHNVYAPTAGFAAIYKTLQAERFFVISVDTPFVGEKEIIKLLSEDNTNFDATIAKTSFGSHPLCGIYHHSLAKKFSHMLQANNHKLGLLLKNSNTKFVHFDDEQAFTNINHPHEYKEALKFF